MLPEQHIQVTPDYDETEKEPEIMSSRTYRITKDRIAGVIDEMEAMKQAVWKRLMTERNAYAIYDDTYGLQTADLIGKDYIEAASALEYRIRETLLHDDRIHDVNSFQFQKEKDSLWVGFHVVTIFGEFTSALKLGREGLLRDW